jgi:hypothetical protein
LSDRGVGRSALDVGDRLLVGVADDVAAGDALRSGKALLKEASRPGGSNMEV